MRPEPYVERRGFMQWTIIRPAAPNEGMDTESYPYALTRWWLRLALWLEGRRR